MRLLALDVGESTGVASSCDGIYSTMTVQTMQDVWTLICNTPWDAVVYETFFAQTIGSPGLNTVQLIGGVRALCWMKNIKCMCQTPQARISYIKDAKTLLSRKGQPCSRHEVDALSHLLLFENALRLNGRAANQKIPIG